MKQTSIIEDFFGAVAATLIFLIFPGILLFGVNRLGIIISIEVNVIAYIILLLVEIRLYNMKIISL